MNNSTQQHPTQALRLYPSPAPSPFVLSAQLFDSEELLQQADGSLAKQFRVVGTNNVGMLAWHVTMRTPEYPEGREVVVIANDVTFQSGSFGVKEVSGIRSADKMYRSDFPFFVFHGIRITRGRCVCVP